MHALYGDGGRVVAERPVGVGEEISLDVVDECRGPLLAQCATRSSSGYKLR
ncbi:hypothetical protein [Streptomyces sp. NPDC102462]|uniref:hypothetical protein n=1 Tax=Streptomyces sp. NPDC102462 TaxID=3366178 RepID=UPI00382663E5